MVDPSAPRGPGSRFPVSWAIFALSRAHRGTAARLLAPLGLVPGQELLMFYLWQEDGVSQKHLIELLGLDHSTVAKSIRRMEGAGLLTRTRSPHDGRVTLIHLTDAGRALESAAMEAWNELEQTSTVDLTPEEAEQLMTLARRVVDGIGASRRSTGGAPS